jgi:hypothetical protein
MVRFFSTRPTGAGLFFLLALALSGCGDGRVRTYPVKGVVKVDGKPAHNLQVIFTPAGADAAARLPAGAMTDESGQFTLDTQERTGAPAGEYMVTFAWRAASGLLKNQFDGPDKLKGKYADPAKKLFPVTIEAKSNDLPPFELKTTD